MRAAQINQHGIPAGTLEELTDGAWRVSYFPDYNGPPLSLTLPTAAQTRDFPTFPPVFEGLLPEGIQLEAILRQQKIDRHDYFALLMVVGTDLVGSLTFKETTDHTGEDGEKGDEA